MKLNDKTDKKVARDLIITSIGACIAVPENKKKAPCVMVAYMSGEKNEISYIMVDFLPKNRLHNRQTILEAIMSVEDVKNIVYTDSMGRQKDIYFCRPGSGKITDVVERDYERNSYTGGISEIYSGPLKFTIANHAECVFETKKNINMKIIGTMESEYAENTYEYAAVNAHNACLLAKFFEREELVLETKDKRRVKPVIRMGCSEYMEDDVLWIKPVLRDDKTIEYYLTEEFSYIDGENVSCRSYKIIYSNRLNDYNLIRV